jgi:hypothetical protein
MAVEAMRAEQDLHDADVDTVLDQPCCVGVAQRVRRHTTMDACRGGSVSKGIPTARVC